MKIKYIGNGLLVLLLMFCMTNCNDSEFLQEKPKTFYTLDNIFTSSSQVEQALLTVYSMHRDMLANSDEKWWVSLWKSNGTDIMDVAYGNISQSMENMSIFTPDNTNLKDLYNYFYSMNSAANLVIAAAELPNIKWASESSKKSVIAQARFFRAWVHCNLAELWGPVSIVTEVYQAPKYDFVRDPRESVYQFVIDELTAIENDLPETSPQGGRIVKGAAQHFLCETYLALGIEQEALNKKSEAQSSYAKSITYGSKVIDGGTYGLMSSRFGSRKDETKVVIDIYKSGVFKESEKVDTIQFTPNYYWDLFQEKNVNYQDGNKECVWAIQIDYAAYRLEDKKSKLQYARIYGPAFRDGSSGNITGLLEDVGGRGVSFQVPTFYWKDTIWGGKYGEDMRNSEIVLRRRFKGNVPTGQYYLQQVPWSVLYNTKENRGRCFPVSCKIATDKFTGVSDGENRSNLFRDDYAIRLPETILLRAEAKQRSGDKAGAAADINLLRTRAQCSYMVTASDMDDKFNTILDERARELMYEEHRWNTLFRMGGDIAITRIQKYMLWDEYRASYTRKFNLFPIPQSVIDVNTAHKLEQNPGW